MSTFGNNDNLSSVPKFPKERTVRRAVITTLTAANTTSTILPLDTTGITAGMYVSGNNISISSVEQGFWKSNVTVVTVNAANVIISKPLTKNSYTNDSYEFDVAIAYDNTGDINYFANTYLVDSGRIANATFGVGNANNAVAHVGWNRVVQGTGFVKEVAVANVSSTRTYSNTYLTFTGGSPTESANAYLTVLNGNSVSIIFNANGVGYVSMPTVSANVAHSNNDFLTFTLTAGGRAGRVSAETLACVSNVQISTETSGQPYFPGY